MADVGRVLRVGFVGAGQMGRPMVGRLLGAGFPVSVFVRRPDVADELAAAGAVISPSIPDLSASVDVLCVCTFSDAQLRQVMFDDGALAAMPAGSALVNHVTGSPRLIRQLADQAPAGVRVVDAPMSGSADQIRSGRLTLLVGAPSEDVELVRPVLAAYADPIIHVGDVGDGLRIKLVNNLVFTVNLHPASLAADVGRSLGIPPAKLAQVLEHCSGASRALSLLADVPASAMVEAARPFLAKDVAVVREVAGELGVDLGLLGELAGWAVAGAAVAGAAVAGAARRPGPVVCPE